MSGASSAATPFFSSSPEGVCRGLCRCSFITPPGERAPIVAEIRDIVAGDGDGLPDSIIADASIVLDDCLANGDVRARNALDTAERGKYRPHAVGAGHAVDRRGRCHHSAIIA